MSIGLARTLGDGHGDRRGTRIAARPEEEGANEAKVSTMGWQGAREAVESTGSSDPAAGGMTGVNPVKVIRDDVVTVGLGTAVILA